MAHTFIRETSLKGSIQANGTGALTNRQISKNVNNNNGDQLSGKNLLYSMT